MRTLSIIGILLVVLGIAGLIVENVSFTEKKDVVDIGPVQIQSEEEHNIPIPTIAAVLAVLAGIGLVVIDRRAA